MPRFAPFYPPQWAAEEDPNRPKTPCCNAGFYWQEVTDNRTGTMYSAATCWNCNEIFDDESIKGADKE